VSINDTLLYPAEWQYDFNSYAEHVRQVLCTAAGTDRQLAACKFIEEVLTENQKQSLWKSVMLLARVESAVRILEPRARDHAVHAVLTFVLGAHVRRNFMPTGELSRVPVLSWKLAGLLHDIGYPLEFAQRVLVERYVAAINEIKNELGVSGEDVGCMLVPLGLDALGNGRNAFSLLQPWLDRWGVKLDARRYYDGVVAAGRVDHGMISGLSVLKVVDMMYRKYNPKREHRRICLPGSYTDWDERFFENEVVPACAAIFLHNLPTATLGVAKVDRDRSPLLFLLKLADCLQDWQRPSQQKLEGEPAEGYDISMADSTLVFKAPAARVTRISEGIRESLGVDDIVVESSGQ
jgi:hypothetical protein